MYISFDYPWNLFLLMAIPIIFLIHFIVSKIGRKRALKFANFDAIERVSGVEFFSKNLLTLYLSVLLVLLLCFSAAGLRVHYDAKASEFSFSLAIDSSRSMEAKDLLPSRFDAAKSAAEDFIDFSPAATRFSVVSFAGAPKIHLEMSEDKQLVKSAIDKSVMDWTGGTNIFDAVITSSNLLREENSKAIILLSDGQINVDTIQDAIDYANKNDVVVHTLGVGTKEGGETNLGTISKIDEEALQSLAYNTGGKYYDIQDKQELQNAFKEILSITERKVSFPLERLLLTTAIILFILVYFLLNSSFRRIP